MDKKRRFKISYILFAVSVFFVTLVVLLSLYLSSNFEVGDFVYNEETGLIGEVKGISLPLDYVVQWQDGSFSQESLFDIKKLSELSDLEIMDILEEDNKEYRFYPAEVRGKKEDIIFTITDEVGEAEFATGKILIPRSGFARGSIILRTGEEGCQPNYICSRWSKCQTEYDLYSLVTEEFLGIQYRYCRDYSDCMSDLIDSRKCEIKIPIKVKRVEIDGEEYIEIYDEEKNKLIAKLKETQLENFKKLDIELVV